jgi:hypothetical protein
MLPRGYTLKNLNRGISQPSRSVDEVQRRLESLYDRIAIHRNLPATIVQNYGPLSAEFDMRDFKQCQWVDSLDESSLIESFYSKLDDTDVVWNIGAHM